MSYDVATEVFSGSRYVTDGEQFGAVVVNTSSRVVIKDERTGTQSSIAFSRARPMTEEELEQYCANPSAGDPSPQEIIKATWEYRATWDRGTRKLRVVMQSLLEYDK